MPSSPNVHQHGHGLLLLAIVASLLCTVVTSMDSSWTYCRSSPSSPLNSTFWSNVVALLDMLPSAAAPTGFASIYHGNGTDRAFVRGTCRGDSTPSDCARYLRSAALVIRSRCNSSRRAGIFYDDGSTVTYPAPMMCFVSYADTNTTTGDEDLFRMEAHNGRVVADKDAFDRTYSALMRRLAERVVNVSSTPSPAPMFAAGAAVYDSAAPNGTMYGLLQCMRDTTAAKCNQCLQYSVQELRSCCYGNQGGIVWGYNCYLRMEVYPYYNLALDGPPLHLAPAPSIFMGERHGKKEVDATLAVALPVVGTLLAAVLVVAVILYRRKVARKTPPGRPII